MLAVGFEIPGEQGARFSRAFTRFTEGVKDLSEPFESIGKDLRTKIIKAQFESEGSAKGTTWDALKPRYAVRKLKRWGNKPILEASGKMKRALIRKGPKNLSEVRPLWAMFGVKDPDILRRAHAHQVGAGYLPKRPIIVLNEVDRKRWGRFIQAYLTKRAREAEKAAGGA